MFILWLVIAVVLWIEILDDYSLLGPAAPAALLVAWTLLCIFVAFLRAVS
jgi:hypothetical protein